MNEKAIETKIKAFLTSKNIYWFKVHGSAFMPPGIPDLVCCWNGRFLGIEIKRTGAKNEQSDAQKVHERNIKKAGGIYLLVESLEEVMNELNDSGQ